jgi:hypothetical protein
MIGLMPQPSIPTTTISFNAVFLHRLAVEAYYRIPLGGDDLEGGQHDAVAAVLFSAATSEAIINEVEVASGLEFGLQKSVMLNLNSVLKES